MAQRYASNGIDEKGTMNIFKMYMRYAVCFMILVCGFSWHIFGSSGGPKLPAKIVTPSVQPRNRCADAFYALVGGGLASAVSIGMYDAYVTQPNRMAECEDAGESQNWQPELRLLHKYDYNEMFAPHSAQEGRHDHGALQCSASLAKILNEKELSKILGLVYVDVHQASAAPKAQIMDEAQQAQGCSLLDQIEQQNQHSKQKALDVFSQIFGRRIPDWPFKSFDNNKRDINDFRVQLRCSNMPEEEVQRLAASAGVCLLLKSAKQQALYEYQALTRVAQPTHEQGLSRRVHKANLERIERTLQQAKCD